MICAAICRSNGRPCTAKAKRNTNVCGRHTNNAVAMVAPPPVAPMQFGTGAIVIEPFGPNPTCISNGCHRITLFGRRQCETHMKEDLVNKHQIFFNDFKIKMRQLPRAKIGRIIATPDIYELISLIYHRQQTYPDYKPFEVYIFHFEDRDIGQLIDELREINLKATRVPLCVPCAVDDEVDLLFAKMTIDSLVNDDKVKIVLENIMECVACKVNKKEFAFTGCGHLCLCSECLVRSIDDKKCPMCMKVSPQGVIRIFW